MKPINSHRFNDEMMSSSDETCLFWVSCFILKSRPAFLLSFILAPTPSCESPVSRCPSCPWLFSAVLPNPTVPIVLVSLCPGWVTDCASCFCSLQHCRSVFFKFMFMFFFLCVFCCSWLALSCLVLWFVALPCVCLNCSCGSLLLHCVIENTDGGEVKLNRLLYWLNFKSHTCSVTGKHSQALSARSNRPHLAIQSVFFVCL